MGEDMAKPTPEPGPTPGSIMKTARERAGKSQAQIAAELGVTQPLIFKWEHDISHPRTEDVRRVAKAYGIRLDLLIPEAKSA